MINEEVELSPDATVVEFYGEVDVIELVAASRTLVRHVARMLDEWAEMGPGDARNRELWSPLHVKADEVRDLLPGEPT